METIKIYPYYRTKKKLFYRFNGQRFFIERTGIGCYKPNGLLPVNVTIILDFKTK